MEREGIYMPVVWWSLISQRYRIPKIWPCCRQLSRDTSSNWTLINQNNIWYEKKIEGAMAYICRVDTSASICYHAPWHDESKVKESNDKKPISHCTWKVEQYILAFAKFPKRQLSRNHGELPGRLLVIGCSVEDGGKKGALNERAQSLRSESLRAWAVGYWNDETWPQHCLFLLHVRTLSQTRNTPCIIIRHTIKIK